jgi:regulator of replication initiation timing
VHDSQAQALAQAAESRQKAEDPRAQALWTAVAQEMQQALAQLQEAGKTPAALGPALTFEQATYQSLLRLQSRETQVARGGRSGRGRGGASQRQLDQLELTQEQNRYETQREATPAQSPEKREQLQVMNRLQELARRQQDVNDRLKEMQTALQEARTEQQREDIRQQLKRLQDEQQQTLADVDELRQRLDQQANQTSLSDQRRQLEQTRTEVQRAAEATGQGVVSEALAAGTRAQRQFQEMRDQLRQESSSQFANELRDMRAEARQLADREEAIAQQLGPLAAGGQPKRLSDTAEGSGPVAELAAQKQRMTDLVNRAKAVSQQAENSEPLLAEKLYDSLRKLGQDDAGTAKEFQQELLNNGLLTRELNDRLTAPSGTEGTKSLDLTSALIQQGYLPQAGEAEKRARAGIDALKTGVERAAESVIGDDTAGLKLAQSELETATEQLKREAAPAPGDTPGGSPTPERDPAGAPTGGQARSLAGGGNRAAAGGDPLALGNLFPGGGRRGAAAPGAPLTGDGYGAWSDQLREVEEIVDSPDLRNAVAAARERARLLRQDYARNLKKPDWAVIQLEIVKPLLEVRDHLSDELARRESKDSLVPLDRDPVPNRYAESVRKYYEALGKDP